MTHNCLSIASRLSDDELLSRVKSLAGRERAATAELVAHLAEVDARKLYLPAGYSSMFTYCRDALLLSEDAAYSRIEVARAAHRFPVVLDLMVQGALSLTAAKLLARHLTEDNHRAVLEAARGLRTSEVETLIAALAPRPDAPTLIRKVPPAPASPPAALVSTAATSGAISPLLGPSASVESPIPSRPAVVTALAPERYKMQVTISGKAVEMLEMAQDLLRHALPSGDVAVVLEWALRALVTEQLKKKFAETDRPQRSRGTAPDSRHVSAEVKRGVYLRDRGRCAFVGANGRRCGERAFLEFHHVHPYAHGGGATEGNIQLRCRSHNRHEWRREVKELREQEDAWLRSRYSSQNELRADGVKAGVTRTASPTRTVPSLTTEA